MGAGMTHVKEYVRSDGVVVRAHEDKREKKTKPITHRRIKKQELPADRVKKPDEITQTGETKKTDETKETGETKLVDNRVIAHQEFMAKVVAAQLAKITGNGTQVPVEPKPVTFGSALSDHIKSVNEENKQPTETGDSEEEEPKNVPHETLESDTTDGALLAPNGKPSKLNKVQYKQVRSPEFKKWFGDWENDPENASKVLDENGEPLPVYHGTDVDVSKFKESKSKSGHPSSKLGYFFTESSTIADRFDRDMKGAGEFADPAKQSYASGANIVQTFLNIKNPKILSASDYRDLMGDLESPPTEEYGWTRTPENWLELKNKFSDEGFDGVCVLADRNAYDPGLEEYGANQYVVFKSNQIKSSIGNTGEYKSDEEDITKSMQDYGMPLIILTDQWWDQ